MSALSKLKAIIPLETVDTGTDADTVDLLNSLNQFLLSRKKRNHTLEVIRVDAYDDNEDEIESTDLFEISKRFQSYDRDLQTYLRKLEPIATILTDFNQELSNLSTSLITLQQKLVRLSSGRATQSKITGLLNPVILDLMIPPDIVKSVIDDEINVDWLENIKFINEKLQLIQSIKSSESSQYRDYKAFHQLQKGVTDLVGKAVERIRDFLIEQIKLLRSSTKQSSQNIQQSLLQVRELFGFLCVHHKVLADQLKLAYIYTMRWYYQSRFAKYLYALQKLSIHHIDLTLVLGYVHDSSGIFGKNWFASSAPTQPVPANLTTNYQVNMHDYLQSIDKRLEILDAKSPLAIPSQIAESTPFAYWLEFIFNQWSVALLDNVVVEYFFMVEFFYQGQEKFEKLEQNKEWWQIMFSPLFKIGQEFGQWLINHNPSLLSKNTNTTAARLSLSFGSGTYDAFAMLLIIRLIQKAQSTLHNEVRIPILDDYLNTILFIFWPHFTKIIDANCESMKKVILQSSSKDGLAPLNTTQQFAHFFTNLLKLSSKGPDYKGEPLYISVSRLRNDFENSLTKLANHIFGVKRQTEKEIFLFNNYFLVESILKNETDGINSEFINEQIEHFSVLAEAFKKK